MKIVIFYFSGTGNTWWCSNELKNALENLGNDVEVLSIENPIIKEEGFTDSKIKEADHIIVGYPIYGCDVPKNMYSFMMNLPIVSDNKKFAAFCTQAGFSGDGTIFFKKSIEKKGYSFLQSFQINMSTNFNVAMFPFSLSKPAIGKKLNKKNQKAQKKIKRISERINKHEQYMEGTRFYHLCVGVVERWFFRRGERKLLTLFKFSKDRCVFCRLCVKTCPTGNLSLDPKSHSLIRGKNCVLCFRCYNICPTLAINYGKRPKRPEKYRRYLGPVEKLDFMKIRR